MKFKKWTALALALIMLLSMMPTASADIGGGWNDDCPENILPGSDPTHTSLGKHNWVKTAEDPGNSCTSPGVATYRCSLCQRTIRRTTAAPGHKWGEWIVTKQADCRNTGSRYHVCSVCGKQETESIPVSGQHSFGRWIVTEQPTCKTAGTRHRKCNVCGHTETQFLKPRHSWGEWETVQEPTCKENGSRRHVCTVCGETETEMLKANRNAHVWGEWEITKEAACSHTGSRQRICSVCGKKQTERIQPTDHTWGEWNITRLPTCQREGVQSRACSVCGKKQTERVAKLEHAWGEWDVTRQPTCRREGSRMRVCANCGRKQTERIAKLEHAWGEWDVTRQPTCRREGLRMRVCANCGQKQTERIAKADHAWGEWDVTRQPTCTAGGSQTHVCTMCNRKETVQTEPLGHEWGEWRVIKPAEDAPGIRESTCLRCGETMREELPTGNGLQLTVGNLHRSGAGADEVFTFDMTVINRTGGWSLISASAKRDVGSLTDQEGFINWPEDELLLYDERSHSFSYHFRPTVEELENAKNDPSLSTIRRNITVLDREGHTDTVQLVAQLRYPGSGLAYLEGSMDFHGRSNLWMNDSDSFPVTLTLTNVGDVPLTDPVAHCTLMSTRGKTLRTITLQPENGAASFRPGESVPFAMTAQVDAADIAEALNENADLQWVFWAEYGYMSTAGEAASGESNLWRQSIKVWELETGDPRGTLVLPILTGSFEDRVYHPGETVWVDLTVENVNPTDTFQGIRFEQYDMNEPYPTATIDMPDLSLKPGESYTLKHRFSFDVDSKAAKKGYHILHFVAWCHHPSYKWYSNCDWSCVVRISEDDEGGLSVDTTVDYERVTVFPFVEGEKVYYVRPKQLPDSIVLMVGNDTSEQVDASITSDHPEDTFDGELEKEMPIPPGERRMVNFTITPSEEEKQAGLLTRTVTASTPDGALQGSKTLRLALRSGGLWTETDRPGLTVEAGSIYRLPSADSTDSVYRADVTVINTGDSPLALNVEALDGSGKKNAKDAFEGWGSGVDVTDFRPGESFTFQYVISEAKKEGTDDFVRRTLNVRGVVPDTEACVTDSASFCFPKPRSGELRLTVDGQKRSGDPDQAITAYLTLENVSLSEQTVTVSLSATDANGSAPSRDQTIEWPQGGSVTLAPGESYSFGYVIHPTQEEILANKVERTVTADGGKQGFVSSVFLSYPLFSGAGGVAILELEGETDYASPLPIYDSFKAHLTARNMGEMDLENVLFHGMVQSADGKCVAQMTLGASDGGTATTPGQALQCFPAFPVSAEMAAAALSAQCVSEFGESGALTFAFHASYTYRTEDGQVASGVSNMLTYTVPIREEKTGAIDLSGMHDNPPYPTAGDTVTVHLTIRNVGEEDLTGLRLEMQRLRKLSFIPEKKLIDEPKDQVFPAGETRTCDFSYTITPQDAEDDKTLAFKFVAAAENSAKQQIYVSRWELGMLLASPNASDEGGTIAISKRIDSTPPNGQIGFRLNDAVHYTIELTNTYPSPVTNIAVYDDMTGYSPVLLGAVDLESGQTKSLSFVHPITQQDVEQGSVMNSAYAVVVVNDPTNNEKLKDYTVRSNQVAARVEDTDAGEAGAVTITKTVVGAPNDPNGYREGETIQYDIMVHNGYPTDAEVNVEDWVSGTDAPVSVAQVTLTPDETRHFGFSYTVRPNDVSVGHVINHAYAAVVTRANDDALISGDTVRAAPVMVAVLPPSGDENIIHIDVANPPVTTPPATESPVKEPPATESPAKDPPATESPAKDPPATKQPAVQAPLIPPEFVTPQTVVPQTVAPDATLDPHSDGFCRRVLTGMGSSEARYELIFCGEHLAVELSAREMTAEQAKKRWIEAVNAGYDALKAKYSGETAVLIETERTLFFDQLTAFQTVAAAREGEEKALTRAVEQLRNRCLDLCYALHTAPSQRLDSALRDGIPFILDMGDAPDQCLTESEETSFGSRVRYRVCSEHMIIQSFVNRQRETAVSAEEAANAFRKSRALWKNALMKAANALYQDAAPEEKAAIADSMNLFHQWLNARQNVLMALYPQDEATVAEVVSFTMQNRVFELEGLQR